MNKIVFEQLRTGDLVRPIRGELHGKRVEVIDIVKNQIIAATIDEITVERSDGVKLTFPYGYTVSGLYQMFDLC